MANLRTNNLSGEQGQNAYRGSVFFSRGTASSQSDSLEFSGIAIGTSDFTIEGWLYKTKTDDYPVIFDTRESGNADSGGFFLEQMMMVTYIFILKVQMPSNKQLYLIFLGIILPL